jgi:hypothetical protein
MSSMRICAAENGRYATGFIGSLTPYQRSIIHYPLPGAAYWSTETIRLVADRYEGWDEAPYVAALAPGLAKL